MSTVYDVIVCGSGPAGLAAYVSAVKAGANTLLCERLPVFSRKLLSSGGGKCNFSNILPEKEFMEKFGRNGRFMTNALQVGGRDALVAFLKSCGVESKLVKGKYLFPASEKSEDIRNAFLETAWHYGGEDRTSCEIYNFKKQDGIFLLNNGLLACKKLVLATGGKAMSVLGGTGAGLSLAERAGHTIIQPLPAMANILLRERDFDSLAGVSLPDASLSICVGKKRIEERGELLFTHDGFSGPVGLSISAPLYREFIVKPDVEILFNPIASKDFHDWCELLKKQRNDNPKKFLHTVLSWKMPHSLVLILCQKFGFENQLLCELSNARIEQFAKGVSEMKLHVGALCPMEKAMAMSGGVSLKEICPNTMESKIIPGLYFAGEILDLAGPCGGFFIQFSFATGTLAGLSAAKSLTEN